MLSFPQDNLDTLLMKSSEKRGKKRYQMAQMSPASEGPTIGKITSEFINILIALLLSS